MNFNKMLNKVVAALLALSKDKPEDTLKRYTYFLEIFERVENKND